VKCAVIQHDLRGFHHAQFKMLPTCSGMKRTHAFFNSGAGASGISFYAEIISCRCRWRGHKHKCDSA
jgi:hypothetical protein